MSATIPQFELPEAEQVFSLRMEETGDGARVQREQAQAARDREAAEKRQGSLMLFGEGA